MIIYFVENIIIINTFFLYNPSSPERYMQAIDQVELYDFRFTDAEFREI